MSYPAQKLTEVISAMATSPASIQTRVFHAFMALGPARDEDFPDDETRQAWIDLKRRACALPPIREGDGRYHGILRMRRRTARSLAEDLVSLSAAVTYAETGR